MRSSCKRSSPVNLRERIRTLKRDTIALYLAARDPDTPWLARLLCGAVAAYALSPIDLIPDAIPVLGLLDDMLILPAGIWLALKIVGPERMAHHRAEATRIAERPVSRWAAFAFVIVWFASAGWLGWMLFG